MLARCFMELNQKYKQREEEVSNMSTIIQKYFSLPCFPIG